LGFSK